ncbi:MAG: response regulator transcription factor [Crocinitomicaceae bacterium]|nr:response regulator transcription factor [Flavobacteriales bacterium]NQZ34045.1 response regulator transcription factor [Crocinitomicaceae bacterium]
MNKINILVIEDSKEISDSLEALLTSNNFNVVAVATNYKDALAVFYDQSVDLIIIDVFLNGVPDGITFAETISTIPGALKPFIFLTSSKDRGIFERAKLTSPFGFLLKPFNELEVIYAIEMALEKFYDQGMALTGETKNVVINDDHLFIKKNKSLKKVFITDILYVEVENRYCNIHTESERFVVLISLVKVSSLFEKHRFIRTHRNFLVNSKMIEEIILNEDTILLKGNRSVPLSDNYKKLTKDFNLLS